MEDVWIEKYRPVTVDEVVGQVEITKRLKAYVASGTMPHMLFAGPAGVGKTTCAIAIARGFFGEAWRQNFIELNASDERGIDVVRSRIKDFARTAPIGAEFKVIFLDEADALTQSAQAALRRTMERYSHTCRFILSCNYSSRIIDPIQSRCAVFRFKPLRDDDVREYLRRIAASEGVRVEDGALSAILYIAQGDMRRAVNALQVGAASERVVTADSIYNVTAAARPEEISRILEEAVKGNFTTARGILDKLLMDDGLAGVDILRQMHREVFKLNVPDDMKIDMLFHLGEVDFRLVEGGTERIQLEGLIARFAAEGRKLTK
ncbi:MAG: replication factor C small subunit [Thermoplasmata archaeon]|nr:replication factor C small subunit [Thermoplasmata archaeon]